MLLLLRNSSTVNSCPSSSSVFKRPPLQWHTGVWRQDISLTYLLPRACCILAAAEANNPIRLSTAHVPCPLNDPAMTASAHPDATVMNHTHDQTTTQGDKRKLLSSFSLNGDGSSRMDMSSTGSIWSKAASTPQVGTVLAPEMQSLQVHRRIVHPSPPEAWGQAAQSHVESVCLTTCAAAGDGAE